MKTDTTVSVRVERQVPHTADCSFYLSDARPVTMPRFLVAHASTPKAARGLAEAFRDAARALVDWADKEDGVPPPKEVIL